MRVCAGERVSITKRSDVRARMDRRPGSTSSLDTARLERACRSRLERDVLSVGKPKGRG